MNLDLASELVVRNILPRYGKAEAAIIGGSIARDEATPTSDIDLLLLFDEVPNAWRETFKVDGQTVELYGHDLRSFDYFCNKIDRPGGRIPLAMMVIEGRNILPPNASYAGLHSLAHRLYAEGPPGLSPQALAGKRYELTTLLEDLVDSEAPEETLAIAAKLYDVLANFVLRADGAWTGTGKHLIRRLKQHQPGIAADLHSAMTQIVADGSAGKAAYSQLVARALAPYGGPLLEGYHLQAPAEWKSGLSHPG